MPLRRKATSAVMFMALAWIAVCPNHKPHRRHVRNRAKRHRTSATTLCIVLVPETRARQNRIRSRMRSQRERNESTLRRSPRSREAQPRKAARKRAPDLHLTVIRHVCQVSITDSCTAAKRHHYSITASARSRNDDGIVSPMARAALRLTTSSNFTGCSIGRSAGFAPFKTFST
jgi:hypothetical protein